MKLHVIVAGVLMVLAFVAGRLSKEDGNLAQALADADGGGAGVPVGNGDVNGDGTIETHDAVYLLRWLHAGGPAPVPIVCPECPPCDSCCPPCPQSRLPATGQTHCYDNDGFEIDCASADFPGQDGFYQAGCPSEGRFADNLDGTVTDNCTGLMWQKDTADIDGDGSVEYEEDLAAWQDALKYCENLILCNDNTFTTNPAHVAAHGGAKYGDWRLPNLRELENLVDYGLWAPAIDGVFQAWEGSYWSSTTLVHGSGGGPVSHGVAWQVVFDAGFVNHVGENNRIFVRAVRGP